MKNELNIYDKYKETGLFWLEKIPSHWSWLYLSQVCHEQKIKNTDGLEDNVLSLSYGKIIRKKNKDFGLVPKEYNTYQIVNNGNIILRLTDLQNDKKSLRTGLVKETGIITSAYACLKTNNNPAYLHYLLNYYDLIKVFYGLGGGVRQSIGFNDIRKLQLPVPPQEEQIQIVHYLDNKLAKINKLIKAKKKQIELLKEQKQAIINQAVTKGLDPNAKMKPSGVEWIGEIPIEWEIVPLKRVVKTVKTGSTPEGANQKFYETNGFDWFTPSDFNDKLFLTSATRQLSELGIEKVKVFPANTVLMIGIGGTMGKVSISKNECSCNQQINAIICDEKVCESYLAYYLRAKKQHIFDTAKYTTLPILNQEETKSIPFILQSLTEQQKIISFIEVKTKSIDKTINTIKNEIELITEYRTSLISEVVTGKIDVRGIAVEEVIAPEVDEEFDLDEEVEMEDFPESEV